MSHINTPTVYVNVRLLTMGFEESMSSAGRSTSD